MLQSEASTETAERCLTVLMLPCVNSALLSHHQGKLGSFLQACTQALADGTLFAATAWLLEQIFVLLMALVTDNFDRFISIARPYLRPCVQVCPSEPIPPGELSLDGSVCYS